MNIHELFNIDQERRFIELAPYSKLPRKNVRWSREEHRHTFEETQYFQPNSNVAILSGNGLLCVDYDAPNPALFNALPETLTIRTPGGLHQYFKTPRNENFFYNVSSLDNQQHLGELRNATNCYSLIPPSKRINFKKYEFLNNHELAGITQQEIIGLCEQLPINLMKTNQTKKPNQPTTPKKYNHSKDFGLNILDLVDISNFRELDGGVYAGKHPLHSETHDKRKQYTNHFIINAKTNEWRCFRCNSGGGPLLLLSVLNNIIPCTQATTGGLRGTDFLDTLKIAIENYNVKTSDIRMH